MEEILIHIGYHKTGTTWMQQELFVRKNQVFQPLSSKNKGPSSLAGHFIYDQKGYLLNSFDLNEEKIQKERTDLLENIPNEKDKLWVMSEERLSGNPHSGGFDASIIANRIKESFPKGKVLIVIREQQSFLLSNYFQYLAVGGTFGIKKYLNLIYDGKRPGFSPNHIDYFPLISHYIDLFGKKNILVLPYELFKLAKESFFHHLGNFVGKEIPVSNLSLEKYQNAKRHLFISYRFRFLNPFLKSSSVNNHSPFVKGYTRRPTLFLLNILRKSSPNSWEKMTENKIKNYINSWAGNRYTQSNKKVAELIGFPLGEYGYY